MHSFLKGDLGHINRKTLIQQPKTRNDKITKCPYIKKITVVPLKL